MASRGARVARSSRSWRVRVARFSSRRVRTRSAIVSPFFAHFTLSAYKDSIPLKEDISDPRFSWLANSLACAGYLGYPFQKSGSMMALVGGPGHTGVDHFP